MRIKRERIPKYLKRDDKNFMPRKNYSYSDSLAGGSDHNKPDTIERRVTEAMARQANKVICPLCGLETPIPSVPVRRSGFSRCRNGHMFLIYQKCRTITREQRHNPESETWANCINYEKTDNQNC